MASLATVFDYDAHGLHRPVHRPTIPGAGPQTTAAVLDRVLAEDPDRPALIGRTGRFSYGELDAVVNRAAAVFSDLGVGPGDRVAVCLGNDVDVVITLLASQRLGALWVGVNRPLAAPEKTYVLNDCGARVFLALPEFVEQVEANRSELPELEHVIVVDPEAGADAPNSWAARLDAMSSAERPGTQIDPFAPAAIAYTSGTTGFPKGVVHSQHNLLMPGSVAVATGRYGGLSQGVVLPLTILNLQVLGPLTAYQDGAACIAIDRIDPEGLAEWIREERIQNVCGVPTVLHDLLTHPDVKPDDLASLVCPEVGGAECPEDFRTLYKERFGQGVSIGYGMTEAPTAVTWSDPDASPRPGLCGKPLAHLEIRICGEEDETPLEVGETGEICVVAVSSGEWKDIYTPMLGYWNNPEATAKALRGGIYRSGDLGFVGEDGNLFISGRRNELILRGGANVYPAEVERVLQEDSRVAGCAVLGIADERLGERVVAAVELEPGQQASADELIGRCREQLARYKVPDRLIFVESLPRNAMSKVVKRELRPLFE